MNKELLYAAHQLHGMIKIKDEELIDPRGSYPRIKLNPGAAFVCFADDIPALIAIGHLCRITRQKRCKIVADRMTEELLPADEKLLRTFGGENIFVDVAGNCTRSPNAAAIVSQSRYLPAKKYYGRVFGIREDFDEVCNAPETYLLPFGASVTGRRKLSAPKTGKKPEMPLKEKSMKSALRHDFCIFAPALNRCLRFGAFLFKSEMRSCQILPNLLKHDYS